MNPQLTIIIRGGCVESVLFKDETFPAILPKDLNVRVLDCDGQDEESEERKAEADKIEQDKSWRELPF